MCFGLICAVCKKQLTHNEIGWCLTSSMHRDYYTTPYYTEKDFMCEQHDKEWALTNWKPL